jgi:hypothetical protein
LVFLAAAALPVCAVVACSHSSSSGKASVPNTAGIPDDDGGPKALSALCPSEQKKLCDWSAAQGGGYGTKVVCEAGTVMEFPDLATCLTNFPAGCSTATVADWEACRLDEVKDPCATITTQPDSCAPLAACIGEDDGSAYQYQLSCGDDGPSEGGDGSME